MKLQLKITLVAVTLLLTACTMPAVTLTVSQDTPVGAAEEAAPAAPAATAAPLEWSRCSDQMPAELECAQLQVPMDYAAPDGPTITLGVTRVKATDPAKRIGSLVINPGGPGGRGSDIITAQAMNNWPITPRLHESFDLVGLDPRGVGLSTPGPVRSGTLE